MTEKKLANAREYLLSVPGETTQYMSVGYFRNNVMNPCLESTYTFVRHIVRQLIALHKV